MAYDATGVAIGLISSLDDKGFKDAQAEAEKMGLKLEKAGKDGEGSFKKIEHGAKKTGAEFLAFVEKMKMAWATMTKFINASIEKAKADKQLELAVKNNTTAITRQGKSVSELTKEFIDYADARKKATNIDDAATEGLQRMILAAGEVPQNVNRTVEAFQDLEAAAGISAETMSRAWARMAEDPSEALGALGRAGIKIDKDMLAGLPALQQKAIILDKIESKYKGQAEAAAEATGAVGRFSTSMDNLFGAIGNIVVAVLTPFMNGLSKITDFFSGMPAPLQIALVAVAGLSAGIIALGVAGYTTFAAMTGAIKMFFLSLGPIGWAVAGLTAVVGAIGLFSGSGASIKDTTASLDALDASMEKSKGSKEFADNLNNLLAKLKGLREDTAEYKTTAESILGSNDALKKSNVTVANSYADIANKVREVIGAVNDVDAYQLLLDTDAVVKNAKSMYDQLRGLDAMRQGPSGLTDRQERQYQALTTTLARVHLSILKADSELKTEGPGSFFNQLMSYVGDLNMSGTPGHIIGVKQDVLRRKRQEAQDRRTGYVADPSAGPGPAAEQKAAYDLYALRISQIEDEFERRRQEIIKSYFEEKQKIEDSALDDIDKAEGIALIEGKLDKELADNREAERQKLVESLGNGLSTAFGIGTSIVKKDWKSAMLSTISTVSPALGGAFSAAIGLFEAIFMRSSKKPIDALKERIQNALDVRSQIESWADAINKVFGESSQQAISAVKTGLAATLNAMSTAFNSGWTALVSFGGKARKILETPPDFSKWNASQVISIKGLLGKNLSIAPFITEAAKLGISEGEALSIWSSYRDGATETLGVLENVLGLMTDIKDTTITDALNEYQDQIDEIQHQLDTGELTDEEAATAQIAIYDQMIAALYGVEGAQAQINKLEEARYALLKKNTEEIKTAAKEAEKAALSAKQQALYAKIQQIEHEVETGVRRNDYKTAIDKQTLYEQLLGSMSASGMGGTEIYKEYSLKMADMVKSYIGPGAFNAMSGFGQAVTVPQIPVGLGFPIHRTSVNNSSTNSNNDSRTIQTFNNNISLTPNLVQELARQILAQSGRSLLK